MSIPVLFENTRLIAVNKPAGMLVIPDQHTEGAHTLLGEMSAKLGQKLWVVHRIDRDTTGVLIFAKDAEAHSLLCMQFEKGVVHKKYIALVNGQINDDSGSIDRRILIEGRSVSISDEGKESLTLYSVKERFRDFTLLEVEPQTGRRHQIRIHLWSTGHPLAVDPEYTHKETLCLSEFKRNYKSKGEEKPLMKRLSLHAASIRFTDPGTKNMLTIEAPLPEDFEITLKQLRKHNHAQ